MATLVADRWHQVQLVLDLAKRTYSGLLLSEGSSTPFSGPLAAKAGRPVLFITERCVFRLVEGGLELIEVAPGIDLERDIFAHMAFRPQISPKLAIMDERIFRPEPMGLRDDMLSIPMDSRFTLDAERGIFFINWGYNLCL